MWGWAVNGFGVRWELGRGMIGIERLSARQREAVVWWGRPSTRGNTGIICDGAVRSGKSSCLGLGFFLWAMTCFDKQRFAVCGKTKESVRRNLLLELLPHLEANGFQVEERLSKGEIWVELEGKSNTFYLFGGKDEGSAALIQGMTLAGVLFDEAALMPESFVLQATARCSVAGSRLWFCCNPEGPEHWFYKNWILQAKERGMLYVKFRMEDNPSLTKKTREKYYKMYSGSFYQRYVLGEWVAAEGRVYEFFDEGFVAAVPAGPFERYAVSCDYGTRNPFSAGLWGRKGAQWFRIEEYYYDGRSEGVSKTDGEYVDEILKLLDGRAAEFIVVDPSAASFIAALERKGLAVRRANNRVLDGIRVTAQSLREGRIVICERCEAAVREFAMYCWDLKAGGDTVRKEHDHAMDEIRYFAMELEREDEAEFFWARSVLR